MPEVRLVGPNGEQVGIVPISRALDMAVQADLDLVEVAPTARPPVVKIMDYGKFKYENAQKAREARRNQVLTVIKEMKLRPKIDGHDYETKKGHVVRFLKVGDKVKVTIMFRGREQSRPELGFRLLQRLAADVADLGFVEAAPEARRPQHDHGAGPAQGADQGREVADPGQRPAHPARRADPGSQVDGDQDVVGRPRRRRHWTTDTDDAMPRRPGGRTPGGSRRAGAGADVFKKAAVPPTPIAAPAPERSERPERSSSRPPSSRPSGPSSRPSAPRPTSNPSGPSAPSSAPSAPAAPSTGSRRRRPRRVRRPRPPRVPWSDRRPPAARRASPVAVRRRPGARGPRPGAPGPRPPKPTT